MRRTDTPDFKPAPLRWPFLVAMIAVVLGLIAAVETACRLLPAEVDRDLVPGSGSRTSSISLKGMAGAAQPLMPTEPNARRQFQNASTSPSSDTDTTTSLLPASTVTMTEGLGDGSSSEPTPTDAITGTYGMDIQIGDKSVFGVPGHQTHTITLSAADSFMTSRLIFGPRPEEHGNAGPVTIEPTTLPEVVTTVLQKTTLKGVVTTVTGQTTLAGVTTTVTVKTTLNGVASTYVGTTTVDGTPTTFVGTTTLNGVVSTLTATSTLSGAVSSITEVRTLDTVVSEYALTTTIQGVVVGAEPSYVTAKVTTLTDSAGRPTATMTSTPQPIFTPTVVTLTDSSGRPTATVTTSVLAPPRTRTLTNSAGVATATVTEYPMLPTQSLGPQTGIKVYYISHGGYFVGFFLPTLLAVMLTIPVRMIDSAAKQFQPWHALTQRGGAPAEASLCLRTGGIYGMVSSIRALADGQVLVFLTTLLLLASIILVPLSAEAVSLKLHGSCSKMDFRGCAMTLGVFLKPARATMALLGFMVFLMVLILLVLRRWRTGVAANPWSIAAVASLSTNPELRAVFSSLPTGHGERIDHRQLVAAFEGKSFKLGSFFNHYGVPEYGIMVQHVTRPSGRSIRIRVPDQDRPKRPKSPKSARKLSVISRFCCCRTRRGSRS
jgi:hypothetical protein